mgnify:CR=1 FL=1|tara:strand:+ start:427 stop:1278 length:852 start_codon:yes stop_codon:yes gene_type:complete
MNLPELQNLSAFNVMVVDHVAHLELCRPDDFNTMNQDFWLELPKIIYAIDNASVARVIVLSSTGKHFTAGMDLSVFANVEEADDGEPARSAEALRRWILQLQAVFNALEQCRLPVLAAIQGGCIGGGVDMTAAVDCRYCTEDSFFVIKETQLGIVADLGTLQRLPKLMPEGLVRELAYTSRKMMAQEALQSGFVNAVYPDQSSMMTAVMAIAQVIASNSPLTVTGTKELLNYGRNHGVDEGLHYTATWQAGMFRNTDLIESMHAKQEQRDPDYLAIASLAFKI